MEVVDPAEAGQHHHAWLKWLGLEEPPPDADSWVVVARAFQLESDGANSSVVGSRLVSQLKAGGIDARQRLYEVYNAERAGVVAFGEQTAPAEEPAVAVLVHERDLVKAVDIARSLEATIEQTERGGGSDTGISGDELTRQALDAGPPPPD